MQVDLNALFANAPSPYVLLDTDLRMIWANDAYLKVTGRGQDAVIGHLMSDVFPAPATSVSEQMLQGSFRRVFETGQADHLPLIPYPIKTEDGHEAQRYWSATHTPILDDHGRVEFILQNTVEVTDLVQGEPVAQPENYARSAALMHRAEAVATENLALGKMTEFFQSAFDHAPSFMATLSGPDHVFQIVNQAYTDLIGGRDVIGLPARVALPDVEGQGFFELLDRVYQTSEPVSFTEMPVNIQTSPEARPEQRFVDFIFHPLNDDSGTPTGIFVQGHDVTAQINAQAELTARRDKFRIMAQTMPIHVWTAEKDGGLNWLNDRLYEFTGHKEGELYGADWVKVLHPDDLDAASTKWQAAIREAVAYEAEFRVRKFDGTYRWHIVRASPLRTNDGTLTGWVGTNTDIEERKTVEAEVARVNATLEARVERRNRELEELHAALRQSQKLEAIGALAGGIAHDFNNLLQIMLGNLQFAMRNIPSDSAAWSRLDQAMRSVERGATLASQLLSFARKQALAPVVTDLSRLVNGTTEILSSAIGEGVALETQCADGLWNTSIDRNSMENALLNLAINARDAMDGQGKLTIDLTNADLDEAFARTHPDAAPGEYVRLAITDTGCGMAPETLERIFEPFFTTKPDGQGTGLGLSMVYGFAKQSGGHVTIDSTVGVGTTISIYLPRSLEDAQSKGPAQDAELIGGSETILLVEDDDEVRDVAYGMLTDLGYHVLRASDGEQALELIAKHDDIDLLLSDVVMPGETNGQALAEKMRALRPHVPVLFTSGYVQDTIVDDGRLNDGVQLIGKPYTQQQLAQKIREVLGADGTAIPARTTEAAGVFEQSEIKPRPVPRGLRVLICEDDVLIRLDMADELRDAGYDVLEAASARDALACLRAERVDVLITDVGLPDGTGEELAQDARAVNADLPVVFATGDIDVPSAETLGNCQVLSKPFTGATLLGAIERFFNAKPAVAAHS
ncbi:response regulator [Oceaniglobus indicus]|uniref:response regulator n=1 Tax=Oceaniglobus indicus TaxID=2047749 RepID=UPI000C1A375B|nr:response regulator [Oceaniglobus indicus]